MNTLLILALLASPAWAGKKKDLLLKKAAAREATFPALVLLRGEFGVRPPDAESRATLEAACKHEPLACAALEAPLELDPTAWSAACAEGNQQACTVEGWRLSQKRPGVPSADAPDPSTASRLFYGACKEGVGEACMSLGRMYFYGVGVERNEDRYHDLNRQACMETEHPVACALHTARLTTAPEELKTRCDAGEGMACSELARLHYHGIGIERDRARASLLEEQACTLGVLDDCVPMALTLDPQSAASHLKTLCDRGSLAACTEYGIALAEGEGMEEDITLAGALWKEGCDSFYAPACVALGKATTAGELPGGIERGVRLFKDACDRGEQVGCIALAKHLREGKGIDKDLGWASALFEEACDAGYYSSCTDLGLMYRWGEGFPHDFTRARELLDLACEGGDGLGCVERADLPEHADEDVNAWLRLGCDMGEGVGCRKLGSSLLEARRIPEAIAAFDEGCSKHYDRFSCSRYTVILSDSAAGEQQDLETAANRYAETCAMHRREACWAVEDRFDSLSPELLEGPIQTLQEACANKNRGACLTVGDFLRSAKRFEEAASHFQEKCDHGYTYACTQLAKMKTSGEGLARPDVNGARAILKAACESAPEEGCAAYKEFAKGKHGTQADVRWLAAFYEKQKKEKAEQEKAGKQ